jgi:hypothetical protein
LGLGHHDQIELNIGWVGVKWFRSWTKDQFWKKIPEAREENDFAFS